jgi:type I restriction-modification system DNA methylase subunit
MHPEFPQRIHELVERAKEIRRKGIHGVDPEALTKQQLIEPLLEALGYDLQDDVKHEFHILGDQCDYLLETRRPLLFVEAKSLLDKSKGLFDGHREQVLRYLRNYRISPEQVAMQKPVTWLLLTNFAQLHFIRVNEDTPTFSFRLDELEKRADELWELLAPDRLEASRIEELYDQEQKADLDQRFLADLKQWRLILANGFGIANQKASLAELTNASQQLLDRFLFCRMLETHGLIEYNKLARAFVGYEQFFGDCSSKSFAEFLRESLFEEIRAKFNTELFVQPQLCDTLKIDNTFLAAIIGHTPLPAEVALTCGIEQGQGELFTFRHLYSYDFSRMSHDIMGAVYERFLAHKLEQKNGRITIQETDELRKREGIYYTPRYIGDYLIAHTLREKTAPIVETAVALLVKKRYRDALEKIRGLSQLKVLDLAMGSGSFLLRAFDHLLDCYARYNRACRDLKQTGRIRETPGELFGKGNEVAEEVFNPAFYIPSENIFGVDLDAQAVELARLNLWMRLMIAERDWMREKLRTRQGNGSLLSLLPSLSNNLKRGNSLISDSTVAGNAAFDWGKEYPEIVSRGGFDVIVGNPPYERIQVMTEHAPESLEFLKANYKTAESGNFDIYVCFVEKGLRLLRHDGLFGYILPHKFFQADYGKALRQLLSEGEHLREIISFGHEQVFAHVSTYTCLLLLSKARSAQFIFREVSSLNEWKETNSARSATFLSSTARADEWTFLAGELDDKLLAKLRAIPQKLETVTERIFQGLKTSADDIYILEELERREKKVRVYAHATEQEHWLEPDLLHPLVKGGDSRRYALAEPRRLILFPYAPTENRTMALIPAQTLGEKYPMTWQYLVANRAQLEKREGNKMMTAEWYAFGRNQALDVISQPKIFTPDLALRAAYSLDEAGVKFFTGGVAGGYGIIVKPKIDRTYVLSLINSRLLDWYVAKTGTTMRGGWHSYEARFIRGVPIVLPSKGDKPQKKLHDELAGLGTTMLKVAKQRQRFLSLLPDTLAKQHRTPCSLGHYLQKDYEGAMTAEVLIDDVMRKGFLHKINIESDNSAILLSAHVSASARDEPEIIPLLRLRFTHIPLRQFIYACWQQFLTQNARRKKWTTGKRPEEIYHRIVNTEEPLVFFHAGAADNLRAIMSVLEAVAAEAGVSDLAALEAEIKATDQKIDQLVYELYGLTDKEIELVEQGR